MTDSTEKQFREGVLSRVSALETDVSQMVKGLAMVSANQENTNRSLENLVTEIKEVRTRQNQPTNWIGVGGLVFGAFTVAMAVMALSTAPLGDRLQGVESALSDRTELVYSAPKRIDALERYFQRHQEDAIRLAEKAATHDKAIEWYGAWLTFLENQTDSHKAELNELRDRVAKNEGQDETQHKLVEGLEQFSRESAFIHGQRDALEKRVNDIDNLGSRKWNNLDSSSPRQ